MNSTESGGMEGAAEPVYTRYRLRWKACGEGVESNAFTTWPPRGIGGKMVWLGRYW